ncbi:MAG: acetate kinase [Microbacterium sp. SCN 70-200]|uniref:acetate/propionate family kinase n=1 Tax=unclassified Microbacterium TaxID=2609290 RepID=UPI00086B7338|nr:MULTISPECIES: acetate kinase [unclassified Microbacterium]MBN9213628.1 acetate kinase [Microbacterium sp.]ODT42225.1 MAG: acetate kinase [Microbacterium sp. SCN 70-200]OJV79146.1 MAG: acetate kinase [Microbacterium sp. 70-16]
MTVVLVINSGSSSFKYQLLDVESQTPLASGLVERIGQPMGALKHKVLGASTGDVEFERELPIPDHTEGFAVMLRAFEEYGPLLHDAPPVAVGHRVVQGGARFFQPTLIDDLVEINIDELAVLAPLHNPGAVQGIRAARDSFPDLPHVAVFDTAFHQTLPPAAYTYAIDRDMARKHRIRRYGFHGTSHKFVSEAAAEYVGRPLRDLKQIVLHLGNGASVTAVDGGHSVETSMGLTPLEGLVMGTRSGDIDPSVLLVLARREEMSPGELDTFLNKRSGMLGLAGASDMRDIEERRAEGNGAARLAFDVYIHRLRAYIGAYIAQLGGVDVISFTAGVGENSPLVRAEAIATLGFLGVKLDPERNEERRRDVRVISADDSAVTVLVVPTNEELEIARQTLQVAGPA